LNIHARRWLTSLVERLFGGSPAPCGLSRRSLRIVASYAAAAFVWRSMVNVTLVFAILVLLGRVHWLLAAAATSAMATGVGGRLYAGRKRLMARQPQIAVGRVAAMGCAAFGAVCLVAYWLASPATIRAPGIVEYQPLVSVRSSSPGFVRQLHVQDGDQVTAGQVLAVLENQELAAQLRMAELDIEKSVAGCRMLRQAGETAKEQAALAAQQALRKQAAELSRQIESLTIRAPATGKILNRNLSSWQGRYVEAGAELFLLGDERSKEIAVSIQQDDLDLLVRHGDAPVDVRFDAIGASPLVSAIDSIEPRAVTTPLHEALSSQFGGPLAVQLHDDPGNPQTAGYTLLEPHFVAAVRLTEQQSEQLRAGQLATIRFQSWDQSKFLRLQLRLQRWFAGQIAASQ
jgi:multidrug resistance efflux pump